MIKKYKKFIMGFILGALIFGNTQTLASSSIKAINAFYNNIKISVDGKEVNSDTEPFIVDGRTFVPIRVISEALGVNINWNNVTKTVEISNPSIIAITPRISLIKYTNGDIYLGETNNGKKHGHGYMLTSYGAENIANYVNDNAVGYGITSWEEYYDGNNIIMVTYLGDDIPKDADYIQIEQNGDILEVIKTKNNPNYKEDSKQDNKFDVKTVTGLKQYLQNNYSTLNTVIGETKFEFDIDENTTTIFPWDYWIKVRYEYSFFDGAMLSNKYTEQEKNTLKQQLKSHQEKIAKDLVDKLPNKKLYGGYYDSYYRYPTIKIDLQVTQYYSWTNYEQPDYFSKNKYEDAKPSIFRWYDLLDENL